MLIPKMSEIKLQYVLFHVALKLSMNIVNFLYSILYSYSNKYVFFKQVVVRGGYSWQLNR